MLKYLFVQKHVFIISNFKIKILNQYRIMVYLVDLVDLLKIFY